MSYVRLRLELFIKEKESNGEEREENSSGSMEAIEDGHKFKTYLGHKVSQVLSKNLSQNVLKSKRKTEDVV